MSPSPLTYFIRTFGCQMNVADSSDYAATLERLGCVPALSEESADLLIINTCSVRQKAEEKAISHIGEVIARRSRRRFNSPRAGIAVVGCMATVRGEEIRRRFPSVRMILPATRLDSFESELVAAWPELAGPPRGSICATSSSERFLPIIRGCENHCSYCIVPRARGATLSSRPPGDIFDEIDRFISAGVKSITLLGQNVCAYGTDIARCSGGTPAGWRDYPKGYGFADLLADIRVRFAESGVWFKFLTSHPRDVNDKLIDVIAGSECFSKHFHLPLQAGDDDVLRRMGRGYSSGEYAALIHKIRSRIPAMRLTTDIIVGFPGEDEEAFSNTLRMLEEIGFDAAFTFLYSPRAGTPAEKWADPVPHEEKKRRLQILIETQNRITLKRAQAKEGETVAVLVDGPAQGSRANDGLMAGRTREEEVVVFPGRPDDTGRVIDVRITKARLRTLLGEPLIAS